MRIITGFFVLLIAVLAVAGQNEDAQLFFDFSVGTNVIDSVGGCLPESTVTASVVFHGISKLFGYQYYIKYDTASLEYISAKKENDQHTNILDKNGGSSSFKTQRSKNDSTQILIAGYLSGNESSECVSDTGFGLVGLITFKHKKDDTTSLSISSSTLLDCDLEEDDSVRSYSGTITPDNNIPVIFSSPNNQRLPSVIVRNGTVAIDFKKKTKYVLTAVNTLGKKLYTNKGFSETVKFDGRNAGQKAYTSGLIVIRVCSVGNELIIPLMQ